MRRALSVSFALLCLLSSAAALAQPTVSVSVDRDRIAFGETVQLSVRVQTVGVQPGQSDLEAPDLRGFRLVGRYQRNSYDSLRKQNTTVLNLTLQAEATGQLTIEPFTLRSGSTVVKSDPLTITVTGSGPAAPPAGQNQATRPGGDPADAPDAGAVPEGFDRAVFIGWDIDATEVWLGQQVEARLYVYVNRDLRVTNFNVGKIDLEGFWTHERGQRGRTRSQLVQVGDDVFVRDEVAHYQLFPIRTGTLTLPPVTTQMQVSRGGFARRVRRQQLERSAPPLPVTVKALPQSGRPAGFRGPTVGRLDLRASVDRRRVSADEGVQLTVQTRIEGMIANTPELELPD
ncbi:MAG: BatD family protein, partial [Myxococcales bacterium]|nr:BatD family protein [Myxococcales bacterium]